MSRLLTAVRGVIYAAGFVVLWTWLAMSVRRYDARIGAQLPEWLRWPGFALAVAGTVLAAACVATFIVRGRGTPAPFDPPREFVATGPYRWVRNPMYVGAVLLLAGAGLVAGSVAICLLAVLFLVLAHLLVLSYEEPSLASRFGRSYLQYKQAVPRWLPRRPST